MSKLIKIDMKLFQQLLYFLLSVHLLSCVEEVDLDIPHDQPKYVVNSLISPWSPQSPNPLNAFVERSTDFLDSSKRVSIGNANVSIFKSDSLISELNYIDSLGYYSSYAGNTTNIPVLKEGNLYKILVDINDTLIEGEDLIPLLTPIDSIEIIPYFGKNANDFIFSKITFSFTDDIDFDNYYEIQLGIIGDQTPCYISSDDPVIISEPSYPSNIAIGAEPAKYLLFRDVTFNGNAKEISIYYVPPNSTSRDEISSHVIELRFLSISENYYLYKRSWIIQKFAREVNILYGQAEPINIYSNMQGSLGVFAGYNSYNRTFAILSDEIINE